MIVDETGEVQQKIFREITASKFQGQLTTQFNFFRYKDLQLK